MSERSCDNCGNKWTKGKTEGCRYMEAAIYPKDLWIGPEIKFMVGSVCRFYSERVELCGAVVYCRGGGGRLVCNEPKGHSGSHSAIRTERGETPVWPTPELCGDIVGYAGNKHRCVLTKGHTGSHRAKESNANNKNTTLQWGDPIPTPTAFDKAWWNYVDHVSGGKPHTDGFIPIPGNDKDVGQAMWDAGRKDGWRARGKADKEAMKGHYELVVDYPKSSRHGCFYAVTENHVESVIRDLDAPEQ